MQFGVMDPRGAGAGAALSSFSHTELLLHQRNYFALQYVSFVISGDQLIDVKYITIFLLYNLFLLFLSFSLDNEKKEIFFGFHWWIEYGQLWWTPQQLW